MTHLIYDERLLTVHDPPRDLEKAEEFKFVEKRMEGGLNEATGKFEPFKTIHKPQSLIRVIQEENPRVIKFHQGMWYDVSMWLHERGYMHTFEDTRQPLIPLDGGPLPRYENMHGFRFSQESLLTKALREERSGLIGAPTRYGKCFGPETPVMMFDGTIREIRNIKEGDLVMGPDSKSRQVTGVIRGRGRMFRVTPNHNGMSWTCNEDHILHTVRTAEGGQWCKGGKLENITVRDWIAAKPWFRHIRKLRRVSVDFPPEALPVDPYIYGAWLGDGHSSGVAFTNMEPEIWNYIDKWAGDSGLVLSDNVTQAGKAETRRYVKAKGVGSVKRGTNKLRQLFRSWDKSEGIQENYLTNSRENRLQLIAGLIDTDGETNGKSNLGIITKHEKLAADIALLCSTLGFGATVRPCWKRAQTGPMRRYFRVGIRGDTTVIPLKVPRKVRLRKNKYDALKVGFKIEEVEYGDYCGFALNGSDNLFLLADCTVVHNTTLIINTLRAYPGVCTVVVLPGKDLIRQMRDDIKAAFPDREVKMMGAGSNVKYMSNDITVCSMDSMHKLDPGRVRLVLVDEPHALPTSGRMGDFVALDRARKIGFGATLTGRYDNRDVLIKALIGPVLANITFKEAVAEGAICDITVFMLHADIGVGNPRAVMKTVLKNNLWESRQRADQVRWISEHVLPPDWQTLYFIGEEKAAKFYQPFLHESEIAMAKLMTAAEREDKMKRMQSNELKRCLSSNIYAQGVTFHDIRAIFNLYGGGPYTSTIQKPGRLAEIRPGKRCGVMFDWMFNIPEQYWGAGLGGGYWGPVQHSKARLDAYRQIGYNVQMVRDLRELPDMFKQYAL